MKITDPEGKERLQAVRDKIYRSPKGFDMSSFFNPNGACGTTCCIAGELNALDDHRNERGDPYYCDLSHATKLLGLEESRLRDNRYSIFYDDEWPSPFKEQYAEVQDDPIKRADVALRFLDYLIEGGEF